MSPAPTPDRSGPSGTTPPAGVLAVQRSDESLALLGHRVTEAAVAAGASGFTENHDVQVLLRLLLEGSARPGALSAVTGMTSGGMTPLLDRLERSGLLRRGRDLDGEDRRGVTVTPTPQGLRVAELLAAAMRDVLAEGAPEVDDLLDALAIRRRPSAVPLDLAGAARLMLRLAKLSEQHNREVAAAAAAARIRGLDLLPGRRVHSVCCLIDRMGPRSPGDLATRIGRSRTSISILVARLEQAGLVRRVPADPPRRGPAFDVDLTSAGRRLARIVPAPTPALRAIGEELAAVSR